MSVHYRVLTPELHLDVSTLQGLCCTWKCLHTVPELHLNMSGQQEPVLPVDVSTLEGPVLHLEFSTPHRGLSYTWTCLHHRYLDVATPKA